MEKAQTNPYGINRISPSMLMEYQSCPKLFFYRSWLGLKLPQPQIHLFFGTAIHSALNVLYDERKEGTWPIEAAGKTLLEFNRLFTREMCETDEAYYNMLEEGHEILKAYWEEKEILLSEGFNPKQFEIPGKDVMLNPHTKEPLPLPLSYRLDALLEGHAVGEFKTSSAPYDQFEVRSRPQSLSYVWVYYQKHGIIPTLHYVVMIKKRKKNKIQHLKFEYDMSDILRFDAEVRSTLKRIEHREFGRPVKGHAKWCDCYKFEEALSVD